MNNTRFATTIHIMTLLAYIKDEWLTSDMIAKSVNINPAMVRKELTSLKAAGLIESRKGKEGGVRLLKDAEQIFLSDIFCAIEQNEVLGKKILNPDKSCPVGKQINQNLDLLFTQSSRLLIAYLSTISLSAFLEIF